MEVFNFSIPSKMSKLLVLLVAICTVQSATVKVEVKYAAPVLSLSLPLVQKNIQDVVFYIIVNDVGQTARGIQTSTGWQYKTREIRLNVGKELMAYADVYDVNGHKRMTTEKTIFHPETHAVALPLSRRIRGAVAFRDDFNGPFLDTSAWDYEVSMYGGGNWEFQAYTNSPNNVYIEHGNLYLHPTLTVDHPLYDEQSLYYGEMDMKKLFGICTNDKYYGCKRTGNGNNILPPVMSGKVTSRPNLRYGEVEVRAKIPKGDWLWPAIWMLPRKEKYGEWPRSGEIDIMESRGNNGELGVETVTSTLHWGKSKNDDRFQMTQRKKRYKDTYFPSRSDSWHDDFHIWKLEWDQHHITTSVDGITIMTIKVASGGFWKMGEFSDPCSIWRDGRNIAPFDEEFYLILNVAVGGTDGYFPDNANWGVKKPWSNGSQQAPKDFWENRGNWLPTWQKDKVAMIIDYVVFEYY